MSNVVDGYEYPKFSIRNTAGTQIESYDFDLTMEGGLIETNEDYTVRKVNILGEDKSIEKGDKLTFLLHYDTYVSKENVLKFQEVRRREKEGYRIFLIPRADLLRRQFEVKFTGAAHDLGILTGGSLAAGNRLAIWSWKTKGLVDANHLDPDTVFEIALDNWAVEIAP